LASHYDRVHALCRRILSNDADALDATQDALVAVIRSIARFDGRSSFGTWLYRIATNACLDELRRRRRRPAVGLPSDLDGSSFLSSHRSPSIGADGAGFRPGHAFHPVLGGADDDPAEIASAHVDVDAALRMVAVDHRVALVLREVCDLSYEEIADILDIPIGTVRSRIARGRGALADLLTERAPEDSPGNAPARRDVQTRRGIQTTEHHAP
jgi:RNA polymerase sigma-70 factor, ECF subfamily